MQLYVTLQRPQSFINTEQLSQTTVYSYVVSGVSKLELHFVQFK